MDKKYESKGTPKKLASVTELTDKVVKAKSVIIVEYQGIKHKQFEELRRKLRTLDSEFVVAKNRLLRKALGDKATSIESLLEQPNASLFTYKDEVAPLKELLKFFKAVGFGKVKGGLLGVSALNEKEVTRLATLPTKDVLLGSLARQLNAPVQGLHYALQWNLNRFAWAINAVKNKKTV
jgi:large subunit ribosomal protein L10